MFQRKTYLRFVLVLGIIFLFSTQALAQVVFGTGQEARPTGQKGSTTQPQKEHKFFSPGDQQSTSEKDFIPGEVLVKFKSSLNRQGAVNIAVTNGYTVKKEFRTLSNAKGQTYLLLRSEKKTTEEMIQELMANPEVEFAEPNYIYRINLVPNDPMFDSLWGMRNTGQTGGTSGADISAVEAWNSETGSSSVVIAVVDTGVAYNHLDLAANMWEAGDGTHGYNAIDNTTDPMDDNGHGTHCSGTIGGVGNNGVGVAGVAWNVKIMGIKFLDSEGSGSLDDAVTGLEWVLQKKQEGVNLVATSNSWGGGGYSQALYDIIQSLGEAGVAFIAAAGNEGANNDADPHYPSSYDLDYIIAVAATDHNDELAWFSCYGEQSVDLAAPGVDILSTVPGDASYIPAPGDLVFENFEGGDGNWTFSGTNNSWAVTTELEDLGEPPSRPNVLNDSPGENYLDDTNAFADYVPVINLSGASDVPYIGFYIGLNLESYFDYLDVYLSGDGGSTWTYFGWVTGTGEANVSFAIPEQYRTSQFRFRFALYSDYSINYKGCILDNVGIGYASGSGSYDTYSGTSMATPHVAGAYAVLASHYPSETIAQRKARLLDNVDDLDLPVLTGGRLNLDAALGGGGGGETYHSADYNPQDLSINLSELLRVVQFKNMGEFHCDESGEDGYNAGSGDQTCTNHNSDYNPANWAIELTELLRLIQFYNCDGYVADPSGEDGFAPNCGSSDYAGAASPKASLSGDLTGSQGEVAVKITGAGGLNALGFTLALPDGWSFDSIEGENLPDVLPGSGANQSLDFAWITPPAETVKLVLHLTGGSTDQSGDGAPVMTLLYRQNGEEVKQEITADGTSSQGSQTSSGSNGGCFLMSIY